MTEKSQTKPEKYKTIDLTKVSPETVLTVIETYSTEKARRKKALWDLGFKSISECPNHSLELVNLEVGDLETINSLLSEHSRDEAYPNSVLFHFQRILSEGAKVGIFVNKDE